MTIHPDTLGAPVTDLEDFVAGRPRVACGEPPPATSERSDTPSSETQLPTWVRFASIPLVLLIAAAVWTITRPAPTTPATSAPDPAPPAGLTGFAEMYVAAYLTGADGGEAMASLAIGVDDLDALIPYERYIPQAAAVDVAPLGDDYWTVVVAAEVLYRTEGGYGPGTLEYYEVAVAAVGDGLVATSAPLPVSAPATLVPYGTYGELRSDADDATTALLADFLDAYLAGSGKLPRLVTADSGIEPVSPAPAAGIEIRSVRTGEIDGSTWATAAAVLTGSDGVSLPATATVRLVDDGTGVRIAELLPGPPPVATHTR